MKLYTEEQVIEMIYDAHNGVVGYDDLFKKQTPIELPCGLVNITVQHQYHSSKKYYVDAEFVDCTIEQYESIKKEIPNCPLNKAIKIKPIELPSNEGVMYMSLPKKGGSHSSDYMEGFNKGAKWVIEQIKQQDDNTGMA